MNYTVEYATPEEMFNLAMKALPFEYTETGIDMGNFEDYSYGESEYSREIIFPLTEKINFLNMGIWAGGWIDFRHEEDTTVFYISANFGVCFSEETSKPSSDDWDYNSILKENKSLQGWFDTKTFQWEFSVEYL